MADEKTTAKHHPWVYFTLGLSIAQQVYGVEPGANTRKEILMILREVAKGDFTLWDTPEEIAANLTPDLESLAPKLPEVIRDARNVDRDTAKELLACLNITVE
jgi:hypothetical protein